jgi:hypothetical protein
VHLDLKMDLLAAIIQTFCECDDGPAT